MVLGKEDADSGVPEGWLMDRLGLPFPAGGRSSRLGKAVLQMAYSQRGLLPNAGQFSVVPPQQEPASWLGQRVIFHLLNHVCGGPSQGRGPEVRRQGPANGELQARPVRTTAGWCWLRDRPAAGDPSLFSLTCACIILAPNPKSAPIWTISNRAKEAPHEKTRRDVSWLFVFIFSKLARARIPTDTAQNA